MNIYFARVLVSFVVCLGVFLNFQNLCSAADTAYNKTNLLGAIGEYNSQYSPFIMHQEGWQSYLIYYCKNTPINGISRDRVWRIENWEDGINGAWGNDRMVVEGSAGADDELSCSPGIVIDSNGVWHMYYITSKIGTNVPMYMYHATSVFPGLSWTIQGKVAFQGASQPLFGANVFMETPTPILLNNKIVLYFLGNEGYLYSAVSDDGFTFSSPVKLKSPHWAVHGRVRFLNGNYYYVYAINPKKQCCDPPNRIYLSKSYDGINFLEGDIVAVSNGIGWDGTYMWSPDIAEENESLRIYYAGNSGNYGWWGANSSIGVIWQTKISFCIPGAISGCKVCSAKGSAWINTDSKCATNQTCNNGVCNDNIVPSSAHGILFNDYQILSSEEKVMSLDFNISQANTQVLVQVSGTWSCSSGLNTAISGHISIDGDEGSSSKIYQTFTGCPTKHSIYIQSIGNLTLGKHTAQLHISKTGSASSFVNGGTILTVFDGFNKIDQWPISSDDISSNDPISIFSKTIEASLLPRFVVFSGSLQRTSEEGDGMTKIYVDGNWVGNLAINDLVLREDTTAPVENQYMIPGDNKSHKVELRAHRLHIYSEYLDTIYDNKVIFKVLSGGTLIVATGKSNNMIYAQRPSPDLFLSSSNSTQTVLSKTITVPAGSKQNLLVSAQGRWLSMMNLGAGTGSSWLTFDDARVGSTAYQNFISGLSISQRTFQLGALLNDVSPGTHTISMVATQSWSTIPDLTIGAMSNIVIIPVDQTSQCTNECAVSGAKKCSGNDVHICGNYDSDSCLEWLGVANCLTNQICQNGECITSCAKEGENYLGSPACCSGLTSISNMQLASDGTCVATNNDIGFCANCGNRVCGAGENKCNCPQDCGSTTECKSGNNSCCTNNGCVSISATCNAGYQYNFGGCDSQCTPKWSCDQMTTQRIEGSSNGCVFCNDGTFCGQKNANGVLCSCVDIVGIGINNFCRLQNIDTQETKATSNPGELLGNLFRLLGLSN